MKRFVSNTKRLLIPAAARTSPIRLAVSIAKWKNDADSPVMLMVDDLANAYCAPANSLPDARGDWGGLHNSSNSIMQYLETNLFHEFREIRTTFFTVMGPISQYNHYQPFSSAKPANDDKESISFFRNLGQIEEFEIAYHGFNHGLPGETTKDFIQEWETFSSLEDAVLQTNRGIEIYQDIFGCPPKGGKYGGWQ